MVHNLLDVDPGRRQDHTQPGQEVAENDIAYEGNGSFPGLRQVDEGPGFHAPDVGSHEEDDDHPLPPPKDPVHVRRFGDAAPPRGIHRVGLAEIGLPKPPPEGNNEHRIEEHGQHTAPANIGKTGLGLSQVAGTDGPLAEKNGDKGIGIEPDQHKGYHRSLSKQALFGIGQNLKRKGLAASLGQSGRSRCSKVFQVDLAEEIETDSEYSIEDNVDDKPDHD